MQANRVIPHTMREWESGNGSFSFLRTLREWEGEWGIKKNFARERKLFFGIASESERQFASKKLRYFEVVKSLQNERLFLKT